MPVLNSFYELAASVTEWRQYLHQNPELDFDVENTARFVAENLRSFGVDQVVTGIARTGVIALINGRLGSGPTIGLRADMDALPIVEASGKPWSSNTLGKMHACGHDGHTAMLLGAAKHLAENRNFRGAVALIFQPAEEGAGGGKAMVDEGIMERFGISQVFGMHNMPGLEIGEFAICNGPIMAALDNFELVIRGKGGHAAAPHDTIDPIIITAQILLGLQTLVSRSTDPLKALVITATKIHAGETHNIIPMEVNVSGTVRTLEPQLRDFAEKRILETARGIASAYGATVDFSYHRYDPVTFNHPDETRLALEAARRVVGEGAINPNVTPIMGSEDFSYMLEARPGAFIFVGNGDTEAPHHPGYDFNDDAIPFGMSYWVSLVETVLSPA